MKGVRLVDGQPATPERWCTLDEQAQREREMRRRLNKTSEERMERVGILIMKIIATYAGDVQRARSCLVDAVDLEARWLPEGTVRNTQSMNDCLTAIRIMNKIEEQK